MNELGFITDGVKAIEVCNHFNRLVREGKIVLNGDDWVLAEFKEENK